MEKETHSLKLHSWEEEGIKKQGIKNQTNDLTPRAEVLLFLLTSNSLRLGFPHP